MRKVYNCFKSGKWFEEAKTEKRIGEVEVCPFCGIRVYPAKGVRRDSVCLWWWLKRLLVSKSVTLIAQRLKVITQSKEVKTERKVRQNC